MTNKEIMEQLKVIRIKKGISQGKLAQALGVSRMSVMNWENCDTSPSVSTLLDICKALGVKLAIKEK